MQSFSHFFRMWEYTFQIKKWHLLRTCSIFNHKTLWYIEFLKIVKVLYITWHKSGWKKFYSLATTTSTRLAMRDPVDKLTMHSYNPSDLRRLRPSDFLRLGIINKDPFLKSCGLERLVSIFLPFLCHIYFLIFMSGSVNFKEQFNSSGVFFGTTSRGGPGIKVIPGSIT